MKGTNRAIYQKRNGVKKSKPKLLVGSRDGAENLIPKCFKAVWFEPVSSIVDDRLLFLADLILHFLSALDGIDDFNRRNYELLSQQTNPTAVRLPFPEDNVLVSQGFARGLGDSQGTTTGSGVGDHFPDPLFGTTTGARLFDKNHQSYEDHDTLPPQRQFSIASAPDSSIDRTDFVGQPDPMTVFSNSMPELPQVIRSSRRDTFEGDLSLRTLPDLGMSSHPSGRIESERLLPSRDIEPIPLKNIKLPGSETKKTSDLGPPVAKKPAVDEIPGASVRTAKLSKDLVECLSKMTYHNIADDQMFEPIPFAGAKTTNDSSEKESDACAPPTSIHMNMFKSEEMEEDTEGNDDEFAEG